jgi:3-hydroxybutyryl-CoA dehydrogenase
MQIAIRSTKTQKEELLQKGFSEAVTIQWLLETEDLNDANAEAFFDLTFNDINIAANKFLNNIIVFANAVNCTSKEIDQKNYIRLNAWPGFLSRPIIELAGSDDYKPQAAKILDTIGWKYVWAPDGYGLIAARIISMIINEAYYALEENISTKEQIDIAMKLGTNYPYGPFEWCEKIGIKTIYTLLQKLSQQNKRYTICTTLKEAANKE